MKNLVEFAGEELDQIRVGTSRNETGSDTGASTSMEVNTSSSVPSNDNEVRLQSSYFGPHRSFTFHKDVSNPSWVTLLSLFLGGERL